MRRTTKLEAQKLRVLIKEYSNLGYEVFAECKGFRKPEAIGDFEPDLILKKGDQTIIVEIATKATLPHLSEKMEQLSRYAAANENVRFDVVLTNPKPRLSREEKRILNESLLSDIQEQLFLQSRELYENGYYESACLVLTILFESILRKFAVKNKVIDIREEVPIINLANLLFESRKISSHNLMSIKRFMECRNRIVHGLYKPEKQELREYVNFVSHFIKRVSPEIRKKIRKESETSILRYLT